MSNNAMQYTEPPRIIEEYKRPSNKSPLPPQLGCEDTLKSGKANLNAIPICLSEILDDHFKNVRRLNSLASVSSNTVAGTASDTAPFIVGSSRLGDRI